MDQVRVHPKRVSKTKIEIIADPKVRGYHDLLVKGGAFYAVYDERTGLWSQNLQVLSELIDNDIDKFMETYHSTIHAEHIQRRLEPIHVVIEESCRQQADTEPAHDI